MVGTWHFSCMDLKSGFWQVKMAEDSRQYTAFTVGSMGVYEFLRMSYSLCNTPAMFQCLMQNCLGELNLMYVLIYLDDIIVYSKMEEEHLICLSAVLERFMEHGLKLKPSQMQLLRMEISYLGHKVSAAGMEPCTEGLKGIAKIAPPATYTQVRKLWGTTGYFRRFIKGYTKIAKPLNDLLQGENSKFKLQPLELPPDALQSFQELKMRFSQHRCWHLQTSRSLFYWKLTPQSKDWVLSSHKNRMTTVITRWLMPVEPSKVMSSSITPLS